MRSRYIIVGGIRAQNPAQVRFAQYDEMVETFPSDRPDQSFRKTVLPRRAASDGFVTDAHSSHAVCNHRAVDTIPIMDQIAWSLVPRECLADLASNPLGSGICGDGNPDPNARIQGPCGTRPIEHAVPCTPGHGHCARRSSPHYAGLVAARLYPNPVGIADFVTSTTHNRGGFILAARKALNSIVFPALQGGPLMHVIAAKAVAFKEALDPKFTDYQKQVLENSRAMARVLTERSLRIVSGRTDSHMFLVDLRSKKITGKDAEAALGRAQITINKNAIPHDPEKPTVTSGLRVGAAAMTTRGFGEPEAVTVAHFVADVLDAPADTAVIARVSDKVQALCDAFPVYANWRS
jgi:Serine hydroxymethyltransferase